MTNIIYAVLPMCAQTEKATFSCKDDCALTEIKMLGVCIIVLLSHLLSPQCGMITCQERFHAGLVIVGEKIDKRGLFIINRTIAEHNKQSPFITSPGCSMRNYLLFSRLKSNTSLKSTRTYPSK